MAACVREANKGQVLEGRQTYSPRCTPGRGSCCHPGCAPWSQAASILKGKKINTQRCDPKRRGLGVALGCAVTSQSESGQGEAGLTQGSRSPWRLRGTRPPPPAPGNLLQWRGALLPTSGQPPSVRTAEPVGSGEPVLSLCPRSSPTWGHENHVRKRFSHSLLASVSFFFLT